VLVDKEMWEKIVLNLISNALKFTMHGHIAVTLSTPASNRTVNTPPLSSGQTSALTMCVVCRHQ
jgi:signal transduction histidine kinase